MKNIGYLFILCLVFTVSTTYSQRLNRFNIAGTQDIKSIYKSITELEELSLKTVNIKRTLAELYYNIGDFLNAEIYYYDVVSSPDKTVQDIYNYSSILLINENYSEANYWMNEFAQSEKNDSRAKRFLKDPEYYEYLLLDQEQFKIKNIDINTAFKEYGTSYNDAQLVFTSSRSKIALKKRIKRRRPALKVFTAKHIRGKLSNLKMFNDFNNKNYRHIHVAYSDEGNIAGYTSYNTKTIGKSGVRKLQIYFFEYEKGTRSEPIPCPFNSEEYSIGFPAFNEQGDEMYFTSDMPGGFGGTDIYMSFKNADGIWVEPVNLGPAINTEGNEMFPFIHESGYLFFSSDGIPGLGGLDVFFSKKLAKEFSSPKNIGIPVNSSHDDFAYILDKRMRRGFFSSNREFGKGDDDIYSFRLMKPLTIDLLLKGKTVDSKGNYIPFANVALYDEQGNVLKMVNSDEEGNYEFKVTQEKIYNLEGSKPKYKKDMLPIKTKQSEGNIYKDLILQKLPDFVISCSLHDKNDHSKMEGVKVTYQDINEKFPESDTTNNEGKLFIGLDEKKLNDTIQYKLSFEKEGYASKSITYKDVLKVPGEYKINVSLKKITIGEDLGKILEINPIYFDYDKSTIRKDAADELDKIIEIMNEYPNMVIELSSHTDCRGSSIYNLKLSDRRAKASAHYIKTRISDPTRIYGEGYGESILINDCDCEGSKKSKCTEEEHQQNRRTEFKIVRI